MYAYHSVNKYNSQFWDQGRSQQCVCDRGFTGFDCSQRICPYGDNPATSCQEGSADDFQLVYMSTDADDLFTLKMRDMFGGTYTTRPINAQKFTTLLWNFRTLLSLKWRSTCLIWVSVQRKRHS